MTVFRNDGRWDTSNVEFDDGRIVAYDKSAPHPGDAPHRLRPGRAATPARSTACPRPSRSTWPTLYQELLARGRTGRLRGDASGSTRSARSPGSRRRGVSGRPARLSTRRSRDELHANSTWPRPTEIIDAAGRRRPSSGWSSCSRDARERGGRLFILGVGGSAANASHAVNDFRKIAGIEAYAPTDNVSELTARTNDEGWATRLRGLAAGQPADARGRWSWSSRSAAATWRRTSARTWSRRWSTPRRSARRSAASSAATAATPPRWPTPASIVPTVNPETRHAARRGVPGGGLAPARVASRG